MEQIEYQQLSPVHFDGVLSLGNHVHGDNYLDTERLNDLYNRSFKDGVNASWVALSAGKVVGFRLTIAAGQWQPDKWCTPEQWGVPQDRVCYFKCNTVDEVCRGKGVGSHLLRLSVEQARQQGSLAGLAHIWLASPGNSAFLYFSKCGGQLVKHHPNKWQHLSINEGYECPVCDGLCTCTAAEMLLTF